MKQLKPARRERSVSMELMPDDTIRMSETTADGSRNWVHVPAESVGPLAFVLLNEQMRGRLDAVAALKQIMSDNGLKHNTNHPV